MIKKYFRPGFLLLTAGLILSLSSCDPSKKYEKAEKDAIQGYLENNTSMNFELKPSGLYYADVVVGTGRTPVIHDTAYVRYTGKFLDGTVFDTNIGNDKPELKFPVAEGYLIYGFDEGILYMNEGGKATFLVPSKLGYGTTGFYGIDGYTPLLYEVELVRVKPGPAK
jgi:FKBP-type peptidyl-prolyl cis-trans isomerase FkpA